MSDITGQKRAAAATEESQAMLKGLLEYAPDAVVVVNDEGRIDRVNRLAVELFGYSCDELLGRSVELLVPDRFKSTHERQRALYASEPRIRPMGAGLELYSRRKDGSEFPVDIMLSPMESGGKRVFTATIRDITERKRAEQMLSQLAAIVESSQDAIFGETLDGMVTSWNSGAEKLYGYTADEMIGRSALVTVPPDREDETRETLALIKQGKDVKTYESVGFRKDGTRVNVSVTASPIKDTRGNTTGASVIVRDITERKLLEQRLEHEASHDALTGLPNRAWFIELLRVAIGRSKRHDNYLFAVLFLDLDSFKIVNDSLGHTLADQFLIAIARKLQSILRPEDVCARVGGDEFTILLDGIRGVSDATRVAGRIQQDLATQFTLEGNEVFTSASIGIALSSHSYDHPEDYLRDADTAMYRAKALGKGRHEVFDRSMRAVHRSTVFCNPA